MATIRPHSSLNAAATASSATVTFTHDLVTHDLVTSRFGHFSHSPTRAGLLSLVRHELVVNVAGRFELERRVLDVEMGGKALLKSVQDDRDRSVV